MARLVQDDRKATITQITTHYNQGLQKTISEPTTRPTLKQMGYSSRRPHQVPLLSANNRKLRLQFTRVFSPKLDNRRLEKPHSDGSMDPALYQRFRLLLLLLLLV
ncbi:hypothetical protein R7D93_25435 [Vibrio sp. YT-15]|uniref:hypothetical protein n=1 Tax=Vibrio sp. YT-15 TaxID=3074706 RepID=UPI0029650F4E|nr:hypothetical protein [Vibrio sp. YT-15]MDW1568537.1 hypothetical protein [Vibrio sp. YT-15]